MRVSTVKEIRSVHRAMETVVNVARHQPVGVSEIARAIGLDKSTVHRILVTLESAGWVRRNDSGAWSIASVVADLLRSSSVETFIGSMQPRLDAIRDASGETAMLVVIEQGNLSVLAIAESSHALRVGSPVGSTLPARRSSAIRAIAAEFPFDGARFEEMRHIDPDLDVAELEIVRKQGWAVNDGAIVEDVCVIGRVICEVGGDPKGAVIVAGPSSRISGDRIREIGELLVVTLLPG